MSKLSDAVNEAIAEIERDTTLDGSVETLLDKLFAIVQENDQDPVALKAALTKFRESNDKVAAALVRNTPQDPATPPLTP